MRRATVLACILVLGLIALPALSSEAEKGKTHDVTVEVVKYDAAAKTLTFKTEAGDQKTAPVMDAAMKSLEKAKPGEKLVLTCQDDAAGAHQGIAMAKPAAPKKA